MANETEKPEDIMEKYERQRLAKGLKPIERQPLPPEVGAVLDWPWQPFKNHSAQEEREISTRRIKSRLLSEGFDLPEKRDCEMVAHLVEGHMNSVQNVGGIAMVLIPFLERLPNWDPQQPDWSSVERLLLNAYQLPPELLPGLTVIEIRRYLSSDPSNKLNPQAKSGRTKKTGRRQKRNITELQTKVLSLSLNNLSVAEIAEQLGCSHQNVHKHLKAAKKNQGTLLERSHRSVKDRSNVEGLDERQSRPRN